MGSYKAFALMMVTLLPAFARADYHSESYKVVRIGDDTAPYGRPWFLEEYAAPYYSSADPSGFASESVAEQRSPEVYENPAEDGHFSAGVKRVPKEDKNFKKSISPFYTLTDSDSPKYKAIVLKSGVPYCQETKSRVSGKRFRRNAMTCIKCKDPKNGLTHEQCSYTSDPQEAKEYAMSSAVRRYRRSNVGLDSRETLKDVSLDSDERSTKSGPGFRFGEEYFTPAASDEIVKKHKEKTENCEKIVKDSMVCMVCKDPKTNGKYEQCSYTNQPNEKAYSYSQSRTSGNPQGEKEAQSESRDRGNTAKREYPGSEGATESHNPEVDKYFEEQTSAIKDRTPKYDEEGFSESEEATKLESGSESAKDGTCKKIIKDTMVCTVCANPKTGGNYEQCSYAYQPNDKIYQFSKQKSFGYPDKNDGESRGKYSSATEKKPDYERSTYPEEPAKKNIDYPGYQGPASYHDSSDEGSGEASKNSEANNYRDQPSENQESYDYSPYKISSTDEDEKSESERISEKIDKESDCKKVEKDTMTCMVCKDPKTGGNYEQCSYAYQPNDKVFAFSTAKSFGSPEAEEKGSDYGSSSGEYGLASDSRPYVASETSSDSKNFEQPHSSKDGGPSGLDDFYSTAKKKEAIDKVLSEFQREDRSKCKKVLRDKLTCFQCTDQEGMQKEECIFVAARKPAKDRLAYREVKEFQRDPEAGEGRKRKRKTRKTSPKHLYAEPVPAGSENVERETREDVESKEDLGERENVEAAELEPYNFAEETRPTYDKVLGLTLPRYMLTTSEHEAEFDEVVASGRL